jgi:hypothetical protein
MSVQVFKRHGSRVVANISDLINIKEEDVDKFESLGHHILELKMNDGPSTFFRTVDVDGYVRSIDTPWDVNAQIYPYSNDQFAWGELVDWWFDGFIGSVNHERLVKSYGGVIDVDDAIATARRTMKGHATKQGRKKGLREFNIYNWFCNSRRSFISGYVKNHGRSTK